MAAVGIALASVSDAIRHLQLCVGIILGLRLATPCPASSISLIARWYDTSLSTRPGLVWASGALGILLAAPAIQVLNAAVEWRIAYLLLAALFLVLSIALSRPTCSALAEGRAALRPHSPACDPDPCCARGLHFLAASAVLSIHERLPSPWNRARPGSSRRVRLAWSEPQARRA